MIEVLIAAIPLLLLVVSLLLGFYPGCETALRIAARIADRARAALRAAARPSRPSLPRLHAAHGGLLIALGLARRPPPLAR
jgi:hypothetical protein